MFTVRWKRWLIAQSCLWLLGLGALALLGPSALPEQWLWFALALAGGSYAWLWRVLGTGRQLADWATLARMIGMLVTTALVDFQSNVTWTVWTLYILFVTADLLDGWLARRFGGSEAGALLDMETDQFTTLLLALVALQVGVGAWVLALPGLKYGFALAMRNVDGAQEAKPCDGDNQRARLLCAAVMSLLLLALAPALPPHLRSPLCAAALVLLSASFLGDTRFLLHRGARS